MENVDIVSMEAVCSSLHNEICSISIDITSILLATFIWSSFVSFTKDNFQTYSCEDHCHPFHISNDEQKASVESITDEMKKRK